MLPHLLVGSSPTSPEDVALLKREMGVTAVLNLQTEEDFASFEIDWSRLETRYRQLGIDVRRVPVQDFDPDSLRQNLPKCVDALDELLRDGHTVYVHCNMGVNRSPSVAIAYLHWVRSRSLDEAVEHVTARRRCAPYVDAIRGATEDRAAGSGGYEA